MRSLLILVLGITLGISPTVAQEAAKETVVLIGLPTTLERAIDSALKPWRIQTKNIDEESNVVLSDSDLQIRAEKVSQIHQSLGVIWIVESESESILHFYDSLADTVIIRPLATGQSYDEVSAASIALTVKTLLLHGQSRDTHIVKEHPGKIPSITPKLPTVRQPGQWFVESRLAARHSAANDNSFQTRIGVGGAYHHPRLSLGVTFELGTGQKVDARQFTGRFDDVAVRAYLTTPLQLGHWMAEPLLSVAGHFGRIKGSLRSMRISNSRINPSVGIGFRFGRSVGDVRAGLQIHAAGYLRSQRYLVDGAQVLDLPTFQLSAGMYIAYKFLD